MHELTESEFSAAQDAVDQLMCSSRRGTAEREAAEALSAQWEAAIAAPQRTATERQARRALIAETAVRLGLIS